jgi:ribonuclease HI
LTVRQEQILVYADGSCLGNPGPGGWGVVIVYSDGSTCELCGYDPATTNNRMELMAAIEALRFVPRGAQVTLRSDSEYLVKSIKLGWKRNRNHDLWHALDAELAVRKVDLEWVRGHGCDPLNDRADELANGSARAGVREDARVPLSSPVAPWLAALLRVTLPRAARESADGGAVAPHAPEPARRSRATLSAVEKKLVGRLEPVLSKGEALRRCAECGHIFVAASSAQEPDGIAPAYCSLAKCQLKARLSGSPKVAP